LADAIVFAPNTHELLVRLFAAVPGNRPVQILTSDGEFHSARRQFARWEEAGAATVERIATEPFETFSERFLQAAESGAHDFIFVSQVLFGSGRTFDAVEGLAALARPDGPWVVIDGYHAFMAVEAPFPAAAAQSAFYLGGGYKYAMAGEGCAFLHAPPGFGPRPPVTGWYGEFEDLSLAPAQVGYAKDAMRFMGATFDASGLYRFNAVQRMHRENGLTTARISGHIANLQRLLVEKLQSGPFASAELLNPLAAGPHARFLAFRSAAAQRWCADLAARDCIVDVRGDVLRVGLGLYHDDGDIDRFAALVAELKT
jgi:selenocysteine lyase/cysteine desulfurase